MYAKILCGHDLSQDSDPALRVCLDLARNLGASVTVLFVTAPAYPVPPGIGFAVDEANFETMSERVLLAARLELQRRVDEILAGRPIPVHVEVEAGEPGDVILSVARKIGADLVVMGTHGRKGWQHLMLGSVAERLVRTCPVPVLTVRSTSAAEPSPVTAAMAGDAQD